MKELVILIFLFLTGVGYTQLTPEFEFPLYFEDAAGNKDTVILGYDALATDTIDTAFGEVNILNKPRGNGLDVRIGDKTYITIPQGGAPNYVLWPITWTNPNNTYQTKKQILSNVFCYGNGYPRSDTISLQFVRRNLPIKITWDGSLFSEKCRGLTCFYGGQLYTSSDYTDGHILSSVSTIHVKKGLHSDSLFVFFSMEEFKISTSVEGADTIAFLQFVFEKVQATSISELSPKDIRIYPNPFNEILNIRDLPALTSQNLQAELYSLDGRIVLRQNLSNDLTTIDTESLEKGFYYLKIYDSNNNQFLVSSLIVKQ